MGAGRSRLVTVMIAAAGMPVRGLLASSPGVARRGRSVAMRIGEAEVGRKANLYRYSNEALTSLLHEWGEKKFRAKQIREYMYGESPAKDIASMHSLPKKLRLKLNTSITIKELAAAIRAQQAGVGPARFTLSAGFPPKDLTDPHIGLKEAGLTGAAIVQKAV